MNSKLISVLKFILLLAIAFGLLAFAFKGISVRKIFHEILQANMLLIFLSLLISVAAIISRAYRWKLLIESLGYTPRLKNATYSLMVGYFANLAFPRLGEVTRCGSLSKAEDISFNKLLGTVIVERVVDVISLFICLFLTSIVEFDRLGSFLTQSIINPIVDKLKLSLASPTIIIGGVILLVIITFMILYFRKKSKQSKHESKIVHFIKGLISGLRSISQLKRPWVFLFHSVLIWVLYFLSTYICMLALPSTINLGLGATLFVLVVGGLGMSAPVQGGIGAFHLLVSQGLMLYGLSQEDGLSFATLIHTSQTLLFVLLGCLSLFLLFLGNKRTQQNSMSSTI